MHHSVLCESARGDLNVLDRFGVDASASCVLSGSFLISVASRFLQTGANECTWRHASPNVGSSVIMPTELRPKPTPHSKVAYLRHAHVVDVLDKSTFRNRQICG